MTQAYLITFRPAGHFFFGGPVGFSDGFFVQSGYFPQPTTVMGALRAALLTGGGLLQQHKHGSFVPKNKKTAAKKLVGTAKLNSFEELPDFGIIHSLSPVFLVTLSGETPNNAFFPTPADVVKKGEGKYRLLEAKWFHSKKKMAMEGGSAFGSTTVEKNRNTCLIPNSTRKRMNEARFWVERLSGRRIKPPILMIRT